MVPGRAHQPLIYFFGRLLFISVILGLELFLYFILYSSPPNLLLTYIYTVFICVVDESYSLANPMMNMKQEHPQPTLFDGELKTYQLKVTS